MLEELRRRVASEPGVIGVTFVDRLPLTGHPERDIEFDDLSAASGNQGEAQATPKVFDEVSIAPIDPSYFDVLNAPILAGRTFHAGDLTSGARVVIVDQDPVDEAFGGRNPIGWRVRALPLEPTEALQAE